MAGNRTSWVYILLIFLCKLLNAIGQDNDSTTEGTHITVTDKSTTTQLPTTTTHLPTDPPTTIAPNTDLAVCTCDLKFKSCDVDCCCDEDCTSDDTRAFSRCIDRYNPPDSQVCLKRTIIFKHNSPYEVNETDPSLFCIVRDNYAERNYYELPTSVDTNKKFSAYRRKYGGSSYMPIGRSEEFPQTIYKSGDPLIVVYYSLVLGKLSLPHSMLSNTCVDNNPAEFLSDVSSQCVRPLVSIQEECTATPALSAEAFYKNFKIIKSPDLVDSIITITAADEMKVLIDIYNSSLVVDVQLADTHLCLDRLGTSRPCNITADTPKLEQDSGAWYCNNSVIKVDYVLEHEGTRGISSATVRFTFGAVYNTSLPLTQTFTLKYTKVHSVDVPFARSGNPGYIIGEPLLAGNLTSQTLPDDSVRKWIDLNTDQDNWLTIARSSATGNCDEAADLRVPVTFGENLRSGCTLVVTYSNVTSDVCALLQQQVMQTLLGQLPPTHVAIFGNSSPTKTGDWVRILMENEPEGVTDTSGGCLEMSLGLNVEVMYANVGALGNPQAKVIGVNFRWEEPNDIFFQCSGPYCLPGSEEMLTQTFEVVSSVTYIDASEKAIGVDAEKPQFSVKLPEDFFFPFT